MCITHPVKITDADHVIGYKVMERTDKGYRPIFQVTTYFSQPIPLGWRTECHRGHENDERNPSIERTPFHAVPKAEQAFELLSEVKDSLCYYDFAKWGIRDGVNLKSLVVVKVKLEGRLIRDDDDDPYVDSSMRGQVGGDFMTILEEVEA